MIKKKGQATIESVLLMLMLLSLATLILKTTMRDGEWIKKIVGTPGAYIRGMSIAGVWKKCENISQFPAQISNCSAIADHPNHIENSVLQTKGESAQ